MGSPDLHQPLLQRLVPSSPRRRTLTLLPYIFLIALFQLLIYSNYPSATIFLAISERFHLTPLKEASLQQQGYHCAAHQSASDRWCMKPVTGVPIRGYNLPLVLGIGPAKTSSTALFRVLGRHPSILLGAASLGGNTCCDEELYFFTRYWQPAYDAAASMAKYFTAADKPTPFYVAEKTPEYSDHLLVPYRVKSMLTPSAVILVYSVRDPIDAHVSLYFHRMKEMNVTGTALGFLVWSAAKLEAHAAYTQCAAKVLGRAGFRANGTTISAQLAWIGQQQYDEAVHFACRADHYGPMDDLEGVGSLLYTQTFLRWYRVLRTSPGMCVFHEDFVEDAGREAKRVFQNLGLPRSHKLRLQQPELDVLTGVAELTGRQRVATSVDGDDPVIASAVKSHFKKLAAAFEGEYDFAERFCDQVEKRSFA